MLDVVPRFLVSDVDPRASLVTLPTDETHHLTHVLRLGQGAEVSVFDGRGREWLGRVASTGRRGAIVELVRETVPLVEPSVRVTLAVGLLKGDQMDAVIRDAVMLGVSAIVPMTSAHVAVSKRAQARDAAERWRRIAVSSAKQCRRAVVPVISPVTAFGSVLVQGGFDGKLIAVEPAANSPQGEPHGRGRAVPPRLGTALLLIGPEGGWSSEEVEQATRAGAVRLDLGPRTLRAQSAPVVALSSLWTIWGWT
jgi:16S rRNA (uracil1498-N3)-methyltransferase